MLVTLSGIVTFPEQVLPSMRMPLTTTSGFSSLFAVSHDVRSNASEPMLVTLSGIVMPVRLVQLENALEPMLVTPSVIVILVRLVHSENA